MGEGLVTLGFVFTLNITDHRLTFLPALLLKNRQFIRPDEPRASAAFATCGRRLVTLSHVGEYIPTRVVGCVRTLTFVVMCSP